MTNPNPLIITNKFPSWIIQDKNQPPSWPSRPASDRLGLIYFCFLAETSILPFYPSTRNRPQQPDKWSGGDSPHLPREAETKGESGWWVHTAVSVCHLSCVIWPVSSPGQSSCHPDISVTSPRHWPTSSVTSSPGQPGPGARLLKYFESDEEHIFTRHAGVYLLSCCLAGPAGCLAPEPANNWRVAFKYLEMHD